MKWAGAGVIRAGVRDLESNLKVYAARLTVHRRG
jgi:hypothetical protein